MDEPNYDNDKYHQNDLEDYDSYMNEMHEESEKQRYREIGKPEKSISFWTFLLIIAGIVYIIYKFSN